MLGKVRPGREAGRVGPGIARLPAGGDGGEEEVLQQCPVARTTKEGYRAVSRSAIVQPPIGERTRRDPRKAGTHTNFKLTWYRKLSYCKLRQ